ncbi:MAG: alpha/beta hydrolase [Verrucomicrobiales bacterium]|nr:alpha/beta hydrolase [Verrucomicrobiales bacterium]
MNRLHLSLLISLTLPLVTTQAETTALKISGAVAEVYKKASGDDLYIYRFDPADHDPAKDKRPAVVFFFGGGWNGGTPNQFVPHSRYLASRGLVTFVADYRVKSRQKATPNQCVADGKSAVRWIRKNADRLGIDPAKVIAGGGSAGGHVAAAAGFCDGLEDEGEDLSISSKPAAMLLFNPVYDNGPKGYGNSRVTEWFPAISPAHNITKDDPPTIVFLGSKDSLIPVSTAEKFRDDMTALGLKSELHVYKGAPHGFFNQGKKPDHFSDTVLKTDQFLVGLGYLSGSADKEKIAELAGSKSAASKKGEK